jgi:TRAP-type C4-dicarboxylate transport system permease small subunit
MTIIDQFFNVLTQVLRVICLGLVIVLSLTVCCKVFFRYVLDNPLVWSDEIIMFILLNLTYFGAALAAHNRSHINVEVIEGIVSHYGKSALKCYYFCVDLIFLGVTALIVVFGIKISFYSADQQTDILLLSYFWVYIILPIGLIFVILMLFKRIYQDLTSHKDDEA